MKIACISDTHDIHYPEIPADVDAVIHAGDITLSGAPDETFRFLDWFEDLPIKHKIFIGGNHDKFLEGWHGAISEDFPSVTMLLNSSYDLEGVKVWGSPVSRAYGRIRAFAKDEEELADHWGCIPDDAEIVVTHGPAYGYLDRALPIRGHENLGDSALSHRLHEVQPLYHICGHIHGSRGTFQKVDLATTFINAAVLDENYRPWKSNTIVIELPRR